MRQPGFRQARSAHITSRVGAWAVIQAGTTGKLHTSYNVSSYTDNGAGDHTLTWLVPFANASSYVVLGTANSSTTNVFPLDTELPSAGSARVVTFSTSAVPTDTDPTTVIAVGRR